MKKVYNEEALLLILKSTFKLEQFRNKQVEIIQSILNFKDTVAILPTGGGKSLCYQLPSVILEGTTIVFSPLISLMKDQVDSLLKLNIPASFLNSSLSDENQSKILKNFILGKYKILYVAPERLTSNTFISALEKAEIGLVVVDEAHCISEWGHDFRPNYRKIYDIFHWIKRVPIAAFTATATPEVREDIVNILQLKNPNIFVSGFERSNLSFFTEIVDDKRKRLLEIIKSNNSGSIIIYVGTRATTNEIADFLRKNNLQALPYNGGMFPEERKLAQEKFIKGEINIIVATNAFGMGIDKKDVRLVIHLDLPLSLEAYYQEAGRAGRDGKESKCYLLYSKNDENLPSTMIFGAIPSLNEFKKFVEGFNQLINIKRDKFIKGTLDELSILFNIEKKKLSSIIRILQRKSLLKFYDSAQIIELQIIKQNPEFNTIVSNFQGDRKLIFNEIIDKKNKTEKGNVELDLNELATELNLSLETIQKEIETLTYFNIIQVNSNLTKNGIKSYVTLITQGYTDKLSQELDQRKNILIHKANKVIEYIKTDQCKQNFIIKYFKDEPIFGGCGKCTTCRGIKVNTSILSNVKIHNFKQQLTKQEEINQKLYSIINQEVENTKSLTELSKKIKLAEPELANIIQNGIENGWIIKDLKFVNEKLINEVKSILMNSPLLRLSQIRERLNYNCSFPELRIAVTLAKKELRMKKTMSGDF